MLRPGPVLLSLRQVNIGVEVAEGFHSYHAPAIIVEAIATVASLTISA
jgi:hypothetical protein